MKTRKYQDDSDLTEIIIQPDGRLYVFGLSAEVADLLRSYESGNLAAAAVAVTETTELESSAPPPDPGE